MTASVPWPAIGATSAFLALCLMLGLKLISPKRFAQILAGLGFGAAIALALACQSAGGSHG